MLRTVMQRKNTFSSQTVVVVTKIYKPGKKEDIHLGGELTIIRVWVFVEDRVSRVR